jgi:hypothetical protein
VATHNFNYTYRNNAAILYLLNRPIRRRARSYPYDVKREMFTKTDANGQPFTYM